jgi:cysteine-rich repeat protein
MRLRLPFFFAGLTTFMVLAACGDDAGTGAGGSTVGGGPSDGGSDTGGAPVGAGPSSGGAPSGGAPSGGAPSGGAPSGGAPVVGGSNTGGDGGAPPTPNCGDGDIEGAEACDDGNTAASDGCSASCTVESGWSCDGEPSSCFVVCGDGLITAGEACDDGNTSSGDGCDSSCKLDPGYVCNGQPSVCALPGHDCTAPIAVTNGFTFMGSNIGSFGKDLFFPDASCSDTDTMLDSPDIVFSVSMNQGQTLTVKDFGNLDLMFQVLDACAVQPCIATYDGFDLQEQLFGLTFDAPATATYFVVIESFEDTPAAADTYDLTFTIQ